MSETPGQVLKRLYREHGMQWEPGWHLDDDFEGLAAAFLAEMALPEPWSRGEGDPALVPVVVRVPEDFVGDVIGIAEKYREKGL